MKFFNKFFGTSNKINTWVTNSFDKPDLLYASRYYAVSKDKINTYYRPYPAMVPCSEVKKPGIFVMIPDMYFEAFKRVVIGEFRTKALQLDNYAVLWIRAVVHDPDGEQIRAMPGTITIATKDSDLCTVPLDLFLDVADIETEDWINAWSQWQNVVFFFVLDKIESVAQYLSFTWPPGASETILNSFQETKNYLKEIPLMKHDFGTAVNQLRTALKSL